MQILIVQTYPHVSSEVADTVRQYVLPVVRGPRALFGQLQVSPDVLWEG